MAVRDDLNSEFLIRLIHTRRFEHVIIPEGGTTRSLEHDLSMDVLVLEPGPSEGLLHETTYRLTFKDADLVKVDLDGGLDQDRFDWDVDDVTLQDLTGDRYELKFKNAQTEITIRFRKVDKMELDRKVGKV